jgi:hypothetical protein
VSQDVAQLTVRLRALYYDIKAKPELLTPDAASDYVEPLRNWYRPSKMCSLHHKAMRRNQHHEGLIDPTIWATPGTAFLLHARLVPRPVPHRPAARRRVTEHRHMPRRAARPFAGRPGWQSHSTQPTVIRSGPPRARSGTAPDSTTSPAAAPPWHDWNTCTNTCG